MDLPFEPVHDVNDYYDGPRTGVAEFRGVLYAFRSLVWEADHWDGDDDRFSLTPVAPARGPTIIAHGEFRVRQPVPDLPPGTLRPLEVRWQPVEDRERGA